MVLAAALGCGEAGRADIEALQAEVAAQAATVAAQAAAIAAQQARLDELEASLRTESAERLRGDLERRSSAPPAPLPTGASLTPSCVENHCVVKRAEVEAALAEPASLTRMARVIPAVQDGKTQGFKLFGIRPGTPLALLGLQNGDIIESLAGVKLDSVESALKAQAAIPQQDPWTLAGVRQGAPFVITIEVR